MLAQIGINDMLAIVGALYIVARVIVLATPTKRDDKALEHVNRWLAAFKTATGLSLNQGIKKHEPK